MNTRPSTLEIRMAMLAAAHTASRTAWSLKPWSWKTNFMWKLTAPMEPMEQKLPISSSQKAIAAQEVGEAVRLDLDVRGRRIGAVGELAHIGRLVLVDEQRDRPGQEHHTPHYQQRGVEGVRIGGRRDALHQQGARATRPPPRRCRRSPWRIRGVCGTSATRSPGAEWGRRECSPWCRGTRGA